MTAELPGLLPFRWEANDSPITPRRPQDDVEFEAVAAGTRAGERLARSGRGHPYVSSNCRARDDPSGQAQSENRCVGGVRGTSSNGVLLNLVDDRVEAGFQRCRVVLCLREQQAALQRGEQGE
jgi:hypothetical protein